MRSTSARLRISAMIAGAALIARVSGAEPSRDPQAAEALFEAGRKAMEAGDYAAACPKLKESYRLDPATGALFALALCHERQGLLASAWVEFMEAAARSNAERNETRERSARDHAHALEPRLSYLTVEVEPAVRSLPGLAVERNGVKLGPAAWGTAIPVDPGHHALRVTAPDREPWTAEVTVGVHPERQLIRVPELERLPPPPPEVAAPQSTQQSGDGGFTFTPLRVAGIGFGGAALASFGMATFAAVRALDMKADWEEYCSVNTCPSIESEGQREAAAANADLATLGVIAGGVLAGTGAILFVLGSPDEHSAPVKAALSPREIRLTVGF